MFVDGTRLGLGDPLHCSNYYCCTSGYNDGEDIWNNVVKNHSNIVLVASGHVFWSGVARRTDFIDCQPIQQTLQNFQEYSNGGDGWLRYYTFKIDENKIEARTFSPYLELYNELPYNHFDLMFSFDDSCDCEGNFDCDEDQDGTDAATFKIDFGRNSFFRPCTTLDPCNGDFDCDVDVDGTDAALFKSDFGRSQFFNPCPICTTDPWCVYP